MTLGEPSRTWTAWARKVRLLLDESMKDSINVVAQREALQDLSVVASVELLVKVQHWVLGLLLVVVWSRGLP